MLFRQAKNGFHVQKWYNRLTLFLISSPMPQSRWYPLACITAYPPVINSLGNHATMHLPAPYAPTHNPQLVPTYYSIALLTILCITSPVTPLGNQATMHLPAPHAPTHNPISGHPPFPRLVPTYLLQHSPKYYLMCQFSCLHTTGQPAGTLHTPTTA